MVHGDHSVKLGLQIKSWGNCDATVMKSGNRIRQKNANRDSSFYRQIKVSLTAEPWRKSKKEIWYFQCFFPISYSCPIAVWGRAENRSVLSEVGFLWNRAFTLKKPISFDKAKFTFGTTLDKPIYSHNTEIVFAEIGLAGFPS